MMGALLARFKEAKVAYPGGCAVLVHGLWICKDSKV